MGCLGVGLGNILQRCGVGDILLAEEGEGRREWIWGVTNISSAVSSQFRIRGPTMAISSLERCATHGRVKGKERLSRGFKIQWQAWPDLLP